MSRDEFGMDPTNNGKCGTENCIRSKKRYYVFEWPNIIRTNKELTRGKLIIKW